MHKSLHISVIAAIAIGVLLASASTLAPAALAYHHHHHHHHDVRQSNSIDVDQQNNQKVQCDVSVGSCNGNTQQAVNSANINAAQINVN